MPHCRTVGRSSLAARVHYGRTLALSGSSRQCPKDDRWLVCHKQRPALSICLCQSIHSFILDSPSCSCRSFNFVITIPLCRGLLLRSDFPGHVPRGIKLVFACFSAFHFFNLPIFSATISDSSSIPAKGDYQPMPAV